MGGGDRFPGRPSVSQPLLSNSLIQPSAKRRHLQAVVDLGSNGIRCSVSDLSSPTARILPTVYLRRVDISVYDAQFDDETGCQIPIPKHVIKSVVGAIVRFQITCAQIATRTALNADEFVDAIRRATNVSVETLPKELEGTIGAWGIASSFSDIEGLAMDLGGGSMQMTWIISHAGSVRISPKGSFSFPYGAAALTHKLNQLRKGKSPDEAHRAEEAFRREMESNFRRAFEQLEIPHRLVEKARTEGGFPLYLSGEDFYYPISIINGYSAPKEDFENTEVLKKVARTARDIFRVSDRRREQVPSVAFLVNVLAKSVPYGIKEAHFCQGGVREGLLFRDIPPFVRQQDPLEVATTAFARPSAQVIAFLMFGAIPARTEERTFPPSIRGTLIQAFANSLFVHAAMSKELSSTAALYSTSAGLLASTHGIPHADRARLALMLQERYGGELPPREKDFKFRLRELLTPEEVWWIRYLGKLGLVIARLYPIGMIDPARPRIATEARWASNLGKHGNKTGIELKVFVQKVAYDPTQLKSELERDVRKIHKVGKRKNWIGGETAGG
ncbi:putative transcription regulator (RTG2) [Aspergillus novofumigatus IBT 16806]|uniref:Putative sensor of mitochondrial dysfunction Rtg2 n=1 Tax=Aspergillus novofumigatus (strain IBT 16806) TaxID=1392255 RepID=A0A2I1BXA8_ASPN1|nr:putative sensor of mitochondrial dysfunction Rtg2 [Aspergillus novofumigatus IBT 16806]PKX90009.1 putative sensor of mitochondrial dysfunction Rtg2 [Aspergillus novofumigatus IBT 16806]